MCGIAGRCNFTAEAIERRTIEGMIQTLSHRGPDDEGVYISSDRNPDRPAQAGLGHRRLSIIDLERGHQPMANEDDSLWIVFNGEIYNFLELKERLLKKGHRFKTKSDTEAVLHLYEEEGVDCLKSLRGMFAFAIWDSRKERLFLARDRIGKKPLVYHFDGRVFTFASEIKALLQNDIKREIDSNSIDYFLTYGYIPSPRSILKDIKKLPPAHMLIYDKNGVRTERYWRLSYKKRKISFGEAREGLKEILTESVRLRLISDVPLGVFLSGGMDSSTVVAFISRICNMPVKTFTIGFEEEDYSELEFARRIAKEFNTEHREFVVKPDALRILHKLVWHYNEPFGDSSCVPTYYVAKMSRQFVTVALNGDGGDESFAGYTRYAGMRIARYLRRLPRPLIAAMFILSKKDRSLFSRALIRGFNIKPGAGYIERMLAGLLNYGNEWERYASWMSCFREEEKQHLYTDDFKGQLNSHVPEYILNLAGCEADDAAETAMEVDVNSYLPEDLLVKMDIATMANSLEARSPFLDHKLMEFAASLPLNFKMRKYILKELARDLLPKEILQRKKAGFAIPVDKWFREELKQFSYEVLLDAKCVERGYFRRESVKNLLDGHSSGKFNHGSRIWNLLNLEIWHRIFIDQTCPQEITV